jgi:hypothetical protein
LKTAIENDGHHIKRYVTVEYDVIPWTTLVTPLRVWNKIMIVSQVNPVAGGASDVLQIVDSTPAPNTNILPTGNVTWSGLPAGVTATAQSNNTTWTIAAVASAALGSASATFTYVGPSDLANPSSAQVTISGTLMVNVTAAVAGKPIVAPLAVDLISGP